MLANQQNAAGSVSKKVDTGSGEDSEAESSKLRLNTQDEGGVSAGDLMEGVAERSPKSVAAVMLV